MADLNKELKGQDRSTLEPVEDRQEQPSYDPTSTGIKKGGVSFEEAKPQVSFEETQGTSQPPQERMRPLDEEDRPWKPWTPPGPMDEGDGKGGQWPPGPTLPPGGGEPQLPDGEVVDTEQPSTQDDADARAMLEEMLKDPTSHLTDADLLQKYKDVDIYKRDADGNIMRDSDGKPLLDESQFMDSSANQLGQLGGMNAATSEPLAPIEASPDVAAESYKASLVDPNSLTKALDEIEKLEPMKAASMADHLNDLLEGMEDGNIPMWARPAVAKVEQQLAGRGISASSIGRDSLFNAIIQAAMPIAQQDATFEQDAYKTNYQAKVQAVLSDVNMEFAAKQFNASSQNQAKQFNAQMQTQVNLQNAARQDAMAQFNAQMQQSNQQFNASQVNTMTQMHAQLQNQRDQFNANMATQIEQSNVQWRRQVNQMNTAGQNAVNQANVQNAFNLSNQALTFLWQEMRDEAQWDFQASEAEKDRKAQLEAQLLANETAMGGEIGQTIESILNGGKALSGFLDSWGN